MVYEVVICLYKRKNIKFIKTYTINTPPKYSEYNSIKKVYWSYIQYTQFFSYLPIYLVHLHKACITIE